MTFGVKTLSSTALPLGTYIDADGDGIGDFKGLMQRLDYLQVLE